MVPHRIRLAGHWISAPLPDGRARHARRFGAPRTLDPGERVWLVGVGVPGPAAVAVNGRPIAEVPAGGDFAADVTSLLAPRNEVTVESAAGPPAELAVEIRPAAEARP